MVCGETETKDHLTVSVVVSEDDDILKALAGSLEKMFEVKMIISCTYFDIGLQSIRSRPLGIYSPV